MARGVVTDPIKSDRILKFLKSIWRGEIEKETWLRSVFYGF